MSLAVNPLKHTLANHDLFQPATPGTIERTHYSGPSSVHIHKSSHSKGSGKHSVALTALTLLSFLFFLHILQNCLQEHMDQMSPQVIIMQARVQAARREAEAQKRKGETQTEFPNETLTKQFRSNPEKHHKIQPSFGRSPSQIQVKLKTIQNNRKP